MTKRDRLVIEDTKEDVPMLMLPLLGLVQSETVLERGFDAMASLAELKIPAVKANKADLVRVGLTDIT